MKLYIGGKYQGQAEIAATENPGAEIIYDFHELVRNCADPKGFAESFVSSHPECIIVADEVGSGVVPIDKNDRLFRENAGRALCIIARNSESVTRVVCGIGVRIK